jgi:hypothetical protein
MRAGREILEARSDGQDNIGLAGKRVGRGRAGDADRAQLQRMIPWQRTLAGLRLGDWNAMRFCEPAQRVARETVEHATAGDDQRPLRLAQHRDGPRELDCHRRRRAEQDVGRPEEILREIVRHGLHVLRQCERDRTGECGIGQHVNRPGQCRQQLLRVHDAIEIT